MTRYPNSTCDAHKNVTTSDPICLVCISNEIESLRAKLAEAEKDAGRYKMLMGALAENEVWAYELAEEMFECGVDAGNKEIDRIIAISKQKESKG